jgi:hypothetical protein
MTSFLLPEIQQHADEAMNHGNAIIIPKNAERDGNAGATGLGMTHRTIVKATLKSPNTMAANLTTACIGNVI